MTEPVKGNQQQSDSASVRVDPSRAIQILQSGDVEILGLFQNSSNYTFLARVGTEEENTLAVYKPREGETPLWDFPEGTLYRREVAAYLVSEALGLSFVPPTIMREGPHGVGSVQLFIDADPTLHYLNMPDSYDDIFRRVCAFDLVINNADRKSGHCLLEPSTNRVWMVDHGVSFHEQTKLRTVIWEFAGERIPSEVLDAIAAITRGGRSDLLKGLLSSTEIAALETRCVRVLEVGVFPEPGPGRPYPWPAV